MTAHDAQVRFIAYILMAADADRMLREEWPISQAEVAARFGRSQSWLSRLLKWYRRIDAAAGSESLEPESTSDTRAGRA